MPSRGVVTTFEEPKIACTYCLTFHFTEDITTSIAGWNVPGAFVKGKGICTDWKSPCSHAKDVSDLSLSTISICQYYEAAPSAGKIAASPGEFPFVQFWKMVRISDCYCVELVMFSAKSQWPIRFGTNMIELAYYVLASSIIFSCSTSCISFATNCPVYGSASYGLL